MHKKFYKGEEGGEGQGVKRETLGEDDTTGHLELLTDTCVCCGDGEMGHSRGMQEIWSHMGKGRQ